MIHQDFLLRQIHQLADAVLAHLSGRRVEPVHDQIAGIAGLDAAVAGALPSGQLLSLLTTVDGLDAPRCLALGLGLAVDGQSAKAKALIQAALAADPRLRDAGTEGVLARLG